MRYSLLALMLVGLFSCGKDQDTETIQNTGHENRRAPIQGPQSVIVRVSDDGTASYAVSSNRFSSESDFQSAVQNGQLQFQPMNNNQVINSQNGYPSQPVNQGFSFVEDPENDFVVNENTFNNSQRVVKKSVVQKNVHGSYYNNYNNYSGYNYNYNYGYNNGYYYSPYSGNYYNSYVNNYRYGCNNNVGYYSYYNYCGNYGGYTFNHYYPYNYNYNSRYWQPTYYQNNNWYYYTPGYSPWYSNGYTYYDYFWMWSVR
ncbi:MAG: hypothetical protein H6621_11145 [Halobacteriovoraceae bacterium]|nr:hypothetical protein [Halobacteriovoraceae bacterium]MCB9095614.1 hypothetical protein [Halobacteriovoraceae bacterium]